MTTPAVSVNQILWTDGITYSYSPTTGKRYDQRTWPAAVASLVKQENRPASTNHSKVKGWRAPGSWSHTSSYRATCLPSYRSTVAGLTYDPQLGKSVLTYQYFEDGGQGLSSSIYGRPSFPVYLENSAISKALLKLKENSSGKRKTVNLGVAFAERRETARLLEDSCRKIANTIGRFRNSSPKQWARLVASASGPEGYDVPGAWLETQYGWKPAMNDVQDACYSLDHTIDTRPIVVTCTAQSREAIKAIWNRSTNFDANFGWRCQVDGYHRSRVRLDYTLDSALLATFASLGLTNPAVIVWERLPYSFVVDWFLPIGDYLSQWDATLGWTFKGGTVSRKTEVHVNSQGLQDNLLGTGRANLIATNGAQWHEVGRGYSRTILTSSPTPRIPSFKDPFSSTHVANAMSLLVNAFR